MTTPLLVFLIIVGAALAWMIGSIALRILGGLLVLVGLANLAMSTGIGVASIVGVMILGVVLWLAGHWLFAVKHHVFASSIARRLFEQVLPRQLNPTRNWGVRVVNEQR